MKGFSSGFLGESVDDMGSCGTTGVDMIIKTEQIIENLYKGRTETFIATLMKFVEVLQMLPQEIHYCITLKGGIEKLMKRANYLLSPKEFLKQIVFNTVFHSIDIASAIAYAIEDALDDGYYQMGYEAGEALNIFLFNDNQKNGTVSII